MAKPYKIFLLGCGLCCISCGPEEIATAAGQFEALTYNVAGLPQGFSKSDPERNIPKISSMLNAYDLVLVQEDFSYHSELIRDITHPHRSIPKEKSTAYVNDGLNRFSRFPWNEFERQQWPSCFGDANEGSGDCLAEKGFSFARTQLSDGVNVDIYNLHAEAGGGDKDNEARKLGIAEFIDFVQLKSKDRAVIIGGDTNLKREDVEDVPLLDDLISKLQLIEACPHVNCGTDSIDRFYFRSNSAVKIEATAWRFGDEFVDEQMGELSDHKAVHVSFSWKQLP